MSPEDRTKATSITLRPTAARSSPVAPWVNSTSTSGHDAFERFQAKGQEVGSHLSHVSHADRSSLAPTGPGGGRHRSVQFGQQLLDRFQEDDASVGYPHDPASPFEQDHTELTLELDDLLAQRRLSHMRTFGGPPEVKLLCHRHKYRSWRNSI